jgi:hypothetical protein
LGIDSTGHDGIQIVSLDEPIKIFPNPSHDVIEFYLNGLTVREIEIIDGNGKCIHSESIDDFRGTLDISDLTPGQYFLIINTSKGLLKGKFIKIK